MAHKVSVIDNTNLDSVGRSYYIYCLEVALRSIMQAKALMQDDIIVSNHELPRIERLLAEAIDAA